MNKNREKIKQELLKVILPEEISKEEFDRVVSYLLTIGWFDEYIELRFEKYLKENWDELVEYAENMTGESYTGREPLLTKETIIEEARIKYAEELTNNNE